MECLDDNAASEFVSGGMAPASQTRIEQHLARCRDCRQLVAALAADSMDDSNAQTYPLERVSPSQVAQRPTRTLTIGDRVGRYLVLSALGAGGMGVVFAAYDPQLDRKVALKLLRAGITYNTKDARARLRREAQAIAQLSHPNVVNVYDVGNTDDGDLYIAMEFVDGETLTSWLKRYPRTPREIIDVFLQAARGLQAAHSVGLLHRDFKPDNVLVGNDGRVRVTDFGLARSVIAPDDQKPQAPDGVATLNVELTATGTVLGTPRYMAPEQLTGPEIDKRADLFSFCVTLYEALYGQHPLPGATSVSMLEKGEKAFPPPDTIKVPPAVSRAVMRGLERDRNKRFATMGELIAELAPAQTGKWGAARYLLVAVAAMALLGGAIAAVLRLRPPEPEEPFVDGGGKSPTTRLVAQLNELHNEITHLREQLRVEITSHAVDRETIQELHEKLSTTEAKFDRLADEYVKLNNKPPRVIIREAPPPGRSQGEMVLGMVDSAQGPIEGCFIEWNERVPHRDGDVMVRLTVNPDGVGHSAESTGVDSPSLKFCLEAALMNNVEYPKGPEQLWLEVKIAWSAGSRMLSLQPRIVGHKIVPQGGIDLH